MAGGRVEVDPGSACARVGRMKCERLKGHEAFSYVVMVGELFIEALR
ncbi:MULTISPECIES: hypothetical protein [unclassified Streptomyces]|nr:hypothetical protein [Streptomyces sp. NBC_00562]WUC24599.1 hypothetical protein OHA33_40750 [Streptomyces sp. NBC_00562]